jgi:diguanylate cyclase
MLFNGLIWPHLAYQWARRARLPIMPNTVTCDAFLGGFWVAAMQFNPLPSATTISMMAMNNVAIGGLRFLLAGSVTQIWGSASGG